MKTKTSDLTATALDWAVAKCEGVEIDKFFDAWVKDPDEPHFNKQFKPSTDWAQGGPIIELEGIDVYQSGVWVAEIGGNHTTEGLTPLVAAMRCFVASKLGDTIDIPEELL